MDPKPTHPYDILFPTLSRYLDVTPKGFQLPQGQPKSSLLAQLLCFRPARTFYQNRKPLCRSLDGLHALKEARTCAACLLRSRCTPQVYIELLSDGIPLKLLLAFSSARNFFTFLSALKQRGGSIENAWVRLEVLDRGRWGEVRFSSQPSQKDSKYV